MALQAVSIPGNSNGECRSVSLGSRNVRMAAASLNPRAASKCANTGDLTMPSDVSRSTASESGLTRNHFLARRGTKLSSTAISSNCCHANLWHSQALQMYGLGKRILLFGLTPRQFSPEAGPCTQTTQHDCRSNRGTPQYGAFRVITNRH